ncbi:hypothetical protein Saa2_04687 [Streptomyces acidiscabies]|nr:hypothetical protein Saa2_04687 [Streptomyces acidiscabies]
MISGAGSSASRNVRFRRRPKSGGVPVAKYTSESSRLHSSHTGLGGQLGLRVVKSTSWNTRIPPGRRNRVNRRSRSAGSFW